MDFELVVVQGRSVSNTIKLADGVTTIGRHDACQLRIKSAQVSRKHCEVFEKKGILLVKDLGSSNGTIVNGKRIDGQRVLEPGDELTIGPVQLRVARIGSAPPAAAADAAAGGKPGDTAVTVAIAAGDSDDFLLDDDSTTQTTQPVAAVARTPARTTGKKAPAPAHDEDTIADFLIDMPIEGDDEVEVDSDKPAKAAAAPAKPAPSKPKSDPQAAAAPPPAPVAEAAPPAGSDDAIADFLLDITLDEEE